MTIQEKLTSMLIENGLFPDQAQEIMVATKAVPDINKSMVGRWNENIEDYPEIMLRVLWLRVSVVTLDWIDENAPLAWFRPLFAD